MNMKELDEILNNLVGMSKNLYTINNQKPLPENWRQCLVLINQGWKIARCDTVPSNTQHLIFVFQKDDKEKEIYMGFADQQKFYNMMMNFEEIKEE